MAPTHTLHAENSHCGWDRDLEPALVVAAGTTVALEVRDASGGQLDPSSTADALTTLDLDRVNPTTGPIHVDGARPGDALVVRIDMLEPTHGWGWTGNIPGFGLLAEDFPEPLVHHAEFRMAGTARFAGVARVPVQPFPGTIGVAPAAPGPHPVIPPRNVGGNLDTRDLIAGSTLRLPVEVDGALFSLGDTHAAQGDGEVCGTAIESPMTATVTLDVEEGAAPAAPAFETVGPTRDPELRDGALATTGVGPDIEAAARDAVRAMIELLEARTGLDPGHAYMLCSVAADLRISEIVNAPNHVVTCSFPKAILTS